MSTEWGAAQIAVPRDRNSTFEPQAVGKRQTRTDDIENRILAMYAKVKEDAYNEATFLRTVIERYQGFDWPPTHKRELFINF